MQISLIYLVKMVLIRICSHLSKSNFCTRLNMCRNPVLQQPAYSSRMKAELSNWTLPRSQSLVTKVLSVPTVYPKYTSHVRSIGYIVRNFSSRSTSPYKVSRDFSRDTLVYSYENKKMFRYLTIFGVVQFILWVNVSSFFYEFFHAADRKNEPKELEKSWWKKLIGLQTKYKYSSSVFCLMIGE